MTETMARMRADVSTRADAARRLLDIDVATLHWPDDEEQRALLAASCSPCVLLVDHDAAPPAMWGAHEDWLRHPVDPEELTARCRAVRRRVLRALPVSVDEDGLLRRGKAWIALTATEIPLMGEMVRAKGRIVRRQQLLAVTGRDDTSTHAFDSTMQRLRRRVSPLGVHIHTVRADGYLLEVLVPDEAR